MCHCVCVCVRGLVLTDKEIIFNYIIITRFCDKFDDPEKIIVITHKSQHNDSQSQTQFIEDNNILISSS